MAMEELYREVILDHFENPRNKGVLDPCTVHEHGANPLCGDKIDIYLDLDNNGKITKITFDGSGCSISQASVSMLTEIALGKTVDEIREITGEFKHMMLEDGPNVFEDEEELEDLAALEGVKNYPVRIKCALLGWNTLAEALKKASGESEG